MAPVGLQHGAASGQASALACSICSRNHVADLVPDAAPSRTRARTAPTTEHDRGQRPRWRPGRPSSMASRGRARTGSTPSDGDGRAATRCGTPGACPAPPAGPATSRRGAGGPASTLTSAPPRPPRASGTSPIRPTLRRAPRRRPGRAATADGHRGDDELAEHADGHVAEVDLGRVERRRVAPARVVDLLRQRLDARRARPRTGPGRPRRRAGSCPTHDRPEAEPGDHAEQQRAARRARRASAARRAARGRTPAARPVPRTRSRTHGRSRGSSMASWRRRTITVRRSWSVAAKRSWPTSVDRRSAASSARRPTHGQPDHAPARRRPRPARGRATWKRSGHSTRSPNGSAGAGRRCAERRRRPRARAARGPPATPTQRGQPQSRRATSAAPTDSPTSVTPASAPVATHARCAPGSRWAARSPAMPPTTRPTKREEPQLPHGGSPERGGAVDRRQQDVAHLGPLQRQRPAAAARPQTERDGEGGHDRRSSPARRPARCATWAAVERRRRRPCSRARRPRRGRRCRSGRPGRTRRSSGCRRRASAAGTAASPRGCPRGRRQDHGRAESHTGVSGPDRGFRAARRPWPCPGRRRRTSTRGRSGRRCPRGR